MARLVNDLLSLSDIELREHDPPRRRVDAGAVLRVGDRHVRAARQPRSER